VADHQFEDERLAALYDRFCALGSRDDLAFYLPMVQAADAVLDAGCGTGMLLHRARAAGHAGRLVGVDPAAGMLAQARRRGDVEWVRGDVVSAGFENAFDLVVMTGHAFQVLVTDDEVTASLAAVRRALRPGAQFAFETRNPSARAWERWTPAAAASIVVPTGTTVCMAHEVELVDGQLVTFRTTYSSPAWDHDELNRSTLRFLPVQELQARLEATGFAVEAQYGDWDRSPLTETSPEIITVATT